MNDKDNFREHVTEMISSISEQVKNIKENVQEMKGLFNKMCDKVEDNNIKTKVLENRVNIIGKILWGVGGTVGAGVIGLLIWIFKEGLKLLGKNSFIGQ